MKKIPKITPFLNHPLFIFTVGSHHKKLSLFKQLNFEALKLILMTQNHLNTFALGTPLSTFPSIRPSLMVVSIHFLLGLIHHKPIYARNLSNANECNNLVANNQVNGLGPISIGYIMSESGLVYMPIEIKFMDLRSKSRI